MDDETVIEIDKYRKLVQGKQPGSPIEEKQLGTFPDELRLIIERRKKYQPFPEGELIILGMGTTRFMCRS